MGTSSIISPLITDHACAIYNPMDGCIIYNIPPDYEWVPPSIIFLGIMDRAPLPIHNPGGYYRWVPAACNP